MNRNNFENILNNKEIAFWLLSTTNQRKKIAQTLKLINSSFDGNFETIFHSLNLFDLYINTAISTDLDQMLIAVCCYLISFNVKENKNLKIETILEKNANLIFSEEEIIEAYEIIFRKLRNKVYLENLFDKIEKIKQILLNKGSREFNFYFEDSMKRILDKLIEYTLVLTDENTLTDFAFILNLIGLRSINTDVEEILDEAEVLEKVLINYFNKEISSFVSLNLKTLCGSLRKQLNV